METFVSPQPAYNSDSARCCAAKGGAGEGTEAKHRAKAFTLQVPGEQAPAQPRRNKQTNAQPPRREPAQKQAERKSRIGAETAFGVGTFDLFAEKCETECWGTTAQTGET